MHKSPGSLGFRGFMCLIGSFVQFAVKGTMGILPRLYTNVSS